MKFINGAIKFSEYDRLEAEACKILPNRAIEAFKPEAFQIVGYPIYIKDELELCKYLDVMHESTFEVVYQLFLQGITKDEFELVKDITEKIIQYSLENFSRAIIPKNSLMVALTAFRHIKALYPDKNATILEIGPGSGYLGLMLGIEGYKYISTDSCQAFYCLQSSVFSNLLGDQFLEIADINLPLDQILSETSSCRTSLHLPWWKFVGADPLSVNLDIDCVVCVNMIAEMQIMAFRYLARQSIRWLSSNENKKKIFYINGTGSQIKNNIIDIVDALGIVGYKKDFIYDKGLPSKYAPHPLYFFMSPAVHPKYEIEQIISMADVKDMPNRINLLEILEYYSSLDRKFGKTENLDDKFFNFCNGEEWKF
jgi:hypothetical protein